MKQLRIMMYEHPIIASIVTMSICLFALPLIMQQGLVGHIIPEAESDLRLLIAMVLIIAIIAIFFRLVYPNVLLGMGRKGLLLGSAAALIGLVVKFGIGILFFGFLTEWQAIMADAPGYTPLLMPTIITLLAIAAMASFEEIVFRGFLLNILMERWGGSRKGIYLIIIAPSLAFGALHMYMGDLLTNSVMLLWTSSIGIFWGALYLRYRSLWAVFLSHALFNTISIAPFIFGIENFSISVHVMDVQNHLAGDLWPMVIMSVVVLLMAYPMARKIEERPKDDVYMGIA